MLDAGENILVLHLSSFFDGFQTSKTCKTKSQDVMYVSLSESPSAQRPPYLDPSLHSLKLIGGKLKFCGCAQPPRRSHVSGGSLWIEGRLMQIRHVPSVLSRLPREWTHFVVMPGSPVLLLSPFSILFILVRQTARSQNFP